MRISRRAQQCRRLAKKFAAPKQKKGLPWHNVDSIFYQLPNIDYQKKMLNLTTSAALFERAKTLIPGGVNSPVRAFRSVGGSPVFMQSAQGAWLTDVDGNRYVDFINSWGPMILGHAPQIVLDAVAQA